MHKKRKIAISPLVPKDNISKLVLVWERPPKNYNPLIIIDDIAFQESDKSF